MRFLLSVVILGVLFVLVFVLAMQRSAGEACYKDFCFKVELARTKEERERGLMYRERLNDNAGMLFIFEKKGMHGFWMKNTLIPLDIIWMDDDGTVVYIKENAKPCKRAVCPVFMPNKKAKYVLEVNAGKVKELGIKLGDQILLKI